MRTSNKSQVRSLEFFAALINKISLKLPGCFKTAKPISAASLECILVDTVDSFNNNSMENFYTEVRTRAFLCAVFYCSAKVHWGKLLDESTLPN